MELYTSARSANGRKVLAALRELELEAEIVEIDVYRGEANTPEYRRIQPQGRVPALVDGDFVLWESNAILAWLAEGPGGGRLTLGDANGRADVNRWLFWETSTWQPAITWLLQDRVAHLLAPDRVPAPALPTDWTEPRFAAALELLDGWLGRGPWVCGDQLTVADLSLAAMAMYLEPCGFPRDRAPNLAAWMERIGERPSWQATRAAPFPW